MTNETETTSIADAEATFADAIQTLLQASHAFHNTDWQRSEKHHVAAVEREYFLALDAATDASEKCYASYVNVEREMHKAAYAMKPRPRERVSEASITAAYRTFQCFQAAARAEREFAWLRKPHGKGAV